MILNYLESMGPDLYDPKATDLPVINVVASRLDYTTVRLTDVAPPLEAPRRWYVRNTLIASDKRAISIELEDAYIFIVVEKDNQFGTKRQGFRIFVPNDGIEGNPDGNEGYDEYYGAEPDPLLDNEIQKGIKLP